MSQVVSSWKTSALIARHYDALPLLLSRFLVGPSKDGPVVSEEAAVKIVRAVYGRASRCTYDCLNLNATSTELLRGEIAKVVGEEECPAVAEVAAFVSYLAKLHIMQPLCERGHLPARFNGPMSFVFMGTDSQCPVDGCRARILDPRGTEFPYNWVRRILTHSAETQVDGGDGQLVPLTDEGIRQMVGTIHPWFTKPVEGTTPALVEIAAAIKHGLAKGVAAIPSGYDVLQAMHDPQAYGIRQEWTAESIVRAARGQWANATNPFIAAQPTSSPTPLPSAELPSWAASLNGRVGDYVPVFTYLFRELGPREAVRACLMELGYTNQLSVIGGSNDSEYAFNAADTINRYWGSNGPPCFLPVLLRLYPERANLLRKIAQHTGVNL